MLRYSDPVTTWFKKDKNYIEESGWMRSDKIGALQKFYLKYICQYLGLGFLRICLSRNISITTMLEKLENQKCLTVTLILA